MLGLRLWSRVFLEVLMVIRSASVFCYQEKEKNLTELGSYVPASGLRDLVAQTPMQNTSIVDRIQKEMLDKSRCTLACDHVR
jgi:hypothetical protein